jgi:hypothetical protein
MGFFGTYLYADGAWTELDPDADVAEPVAPYLFVMIHDSDIAMVRYSPVGDGTGRAFLGYTPRAYFGDPSASAPTDTGLEAAGLAAWAGAAGASLSADEVEPFLASDEQRAADADGVPDVDVFVELKTARFVQALGLAPLPK